jgi:hypothetical protein
MSDRLVIRLMVPGEVDTLREIDLAARSRYRFEKFADAAPIAPDRFGLGLTFVACERDRLLGFAIVQTVDGMDPCVLLTTVVKSAFVAM